MASQFLHPCMGDPAPVLRTKEGSWLRHLIFGVSPSPGTWEMGFPPYLISTPPEREPPLCAPSSGADHNAGDFSGKWGAVPVPGSNPVTLKG